MRDKNHPFWKAVRLIIGLIETILIGLSSLIKCIFVIPFLVALIIFIGTAPIGAFETGMD